MANFGLDRLVADGHTYLIEVGPVGPKLGLIPIGRANTRALAEARKLYGWLDQYSRAWNAECGWDHYRYEEEYARMVGAGDNKFLYQRLRERGLRTGELPDEMLLRDIWLPPAKMDDYKDCVRRFEALAQEAHLIVEHYLPVGDDWPDG
jgi:hypothetical protein